MMGPGEAVEFLAERASKRVPVSYPWEVKLRHKNGSWEVGLRVWRSAEMQEYKELVVVEEPQGGFYLAGLETLMSKVVYEIEAAP